MKRDLQGIWRGLFFWGCLAFAVFQLYTAGFGFLPDLKQRAVHIIFGLVLLFLFFAFKKRPKPESKVPLRDLLLIGIILVANINIFLVYERIYLAPGFAVTKDLILGVLLSVIVLEATRRAVGWVLPALTVLAFCYIFASPYLPGILRFPGLPLEHVIESLYYSPNGIYGTITGVSATIVAVFILFGSLLLFTGGGDTFIDLALRVAGRFRGGPAKVAVIASTLFGTVSGSAVANVAITGNYTIPLMKRLGYSPHFAGGVESTASTGGMITPPIMGVGAFIMAEIIGIPYIKIIYYAIIPCLLFYTCLFAGVHFEALRLGLVGIPKEEIPQWKSILTWKRLVPLFVPILLLIALLVKGLSITGAGFYACVAVMVLFLLSGFSLSGLKSRFLQIGRALSRGGQALVEIVAALVCVNMLINLLSLSGIALKVSGIITDVGEIAVLLGFLVAGIVPIVLGMGITPAASYILAAAIAAPALVKLGPDILQSHMFLFYFASLAPITPPVCLATYVAANIAQTPWVKVGLTAVRLGIVGFLIPFFFIIEPALLARGAPLDILLALVPAIIGASLVASGFFGYLTQKLNPFARLLYIAGGGLLLYPGQATDLLGILVVGVGLVSPLLFRQARVLAANFRRSNK